VSNLTFSDFRIGDLFILEVKIYLIQKRQIFHVSSWRSDLQVSTGHLDRAGSLRVLLPHYAQHQSCNKGDGGPGLPRI